MLASCALEIGRGQDCRAKVSPSCEGMTGVFNNVIKDFPPVP